MARPPDPTRAAILNRLNRLLGDLPPGEADDIRQRLAHVSTTNLAFIVSRLEAGVTASRRATSVTAGDTSGTPAHGAPPHADTYDINSHTARAVGYHLFDDDGNGSCRQCQLPARNAHHLDAHIASYPCTPATCRCVPATPEYAAAKMAEIRANLRGTILGVDPHTETTNPWDEDDWVSDMADQALGLQDNPPPRDLTQW